MPKYKIAVHWSVCDIIEIEAATLEEAEGIALDKDNELTEGEYIDGSYEVNTEVTTEINEWLNKKAQ